MLRALLTTPTRLAFWGGPRSSYSVLVVPIASASARLVARPPAASSRRFSVFASLRALSTVATPIASAANKSDDAVVAPATAAALRALGVRAVAEFVEDGLGVDPDDVAKLVEQKIDGAALLEMSLGELRSYGLSGGAAHLVMRGIAPAVAEVRAAAALAAVEAQSAATLAAVEAQSVTLTIYPPKKKKSDPNQTRKQKLTPAVFERMFDVLKAPLHIVNTSGSVLRVATSLAEAVQAKDAGFLLRASRSYDDDLTSLNGFQTNSSTALEIKSTHALAIDAGLLEMYGPLVLVNSGEELKLQLPRPGMEALELKPGGLVMSTTSSVLLFNSAKHTPSEDDIDQLILDVQKLGRMLSNFAQVSTTPPAAKDQLDLLPFSATAPLRIVPFLSGDNFSAILVAECEQRGIGVVRPSGEGFVVKVGKQRPT